MAATAARKTKQTEPLALLGNIAKDEVSGFKGTVTGVIFFLSGSIQANLQPPVGKDGKMPEAWGFDTNRLTIVKGGAIKAVREDDTSSVPLGATAIDRVTGVTGVVTEKCVYLNGCTHVVLTARTPKKEERIIAVDWKRLDVSPTSPVMSTPIGVVKGGPSRRVERDG